MNIRHAKHNTVAHGIDQPLDISIASRRPTTIYQSTIMDIERERTRQAQDLLG